MRQSFISPDSDRRLVSDMWQLGMGDDRARVAIVGCGGAGCNVLRRVAAPPGAVRIAMNDAPPSKLADVQTKISVRAESLQAYAWRNEKAVQQMERTRRRRFPRPSSTGMWSWSLAASEANW